MNIAAASTRPTRKSPCAQQHVSACFLHSRKVCRAHGKVRTESATARPSKKMPPSRDTLAAASTARRLPVRATIDSALLASAPVSASKASLLQGVPVRQGLQPQILGGIREAAHGGCT